MDVKVKDGAGKARLKRIIQEMDKRQVRIGWFASARYDDKNSTPVAKIAAQNEYGNPAKRIPPRPFMQPTVDAHKSQWKALLTSGSKAVAAGNETFNTVFEKLGGLIAGQIRTTITQVTSPQLSPYTIAARLSRKSDTKMVGSLYKPLIDTGYMYATVTYVVEKSK